ncbi:unnamed protein product [Citrullus colocynthis]|uniref:PCI domain-containing protein n=1 Tax=Citrullus colocynthis TaxID=252529 RepID=A0ABP0Z6R6_9ROSI
MEGDADIIYASMEDDGMFFRGQSNDKEEIWKFAIVSDEGEEEEEKEHPIRRPIMRGKNFDIEAYASNYRGRSKILRLLSIADRCGDHERLAMQLEALRIAYDEAKEGKDVVLFTKVVQKISGRLGPNYQMDQDWCDSVNRIRQRMELGVDSGLQQYLKDFERGNRFLNDIVNAYIYVGDFHYVHGSIKKASKHYWEAYFLSLRDGRVRSLCRQIIIRVLILMIELESPFDGSAGKLPYSTDEERQCAEGLRLFKERHFRDAAVIFLGISRELGSQFSVVMAAHDIAAYGGLCALATMERAELKSLVMDNDGFQSYLNSAIEVRELIYDFYSGRYSSCFDHLHNLREWLPFDIHFHDKFETLYGQIRNKAMVFYVQLFVSVDLQSMANVFWTTLQALENELKALINTNQIQAKIDSIYKVLYVHRDHRNATFRRVIQNCSVIELDFRSMLLWKPFHTSRTMPS